MLLKSILGRLRNLSATAVPGAQTSPSLEPFSDYAREARRSGLAKPYLFLSFDCDTDWDAEVVEEVHDFLEARGISATYAVPGAQLLRSPHPYQRLAARGVEFMNHGALPHAEWRVDQWAGITFYDSMKPAEVEDDIRRGHDIVIEVIGKEPKGFRAPHFGCFQRPEQLELVHRVAEELGYAYCSTTIPSFALRAGPVTPLTGLNVVEIACFGSARYPETILDSWTYLEDRKQYKLADIYAELVTETVETFSKKSTPALFTWYADPCHVAGQSPFRLAIEAIERNGIPSLTGSEVVAFFGKKA